MVKIAHVSDTHNKPHIILKFAKSDAELLVMSGDCMDERGSFMTPKHIQARWQDGWMKSQAPSWVKAFKGRPVVVVRGNHDHTGYTRWLKHFGANIYELTDDVMHYDLLGLRFAGFRQVPYINGFFAGESRDLSPYVDKVRQLRPDVLVTHSPSQGILDEGFGCPSLRNYVLSKDHNLVGHLFGHCHQDTGYIQAGPVMFSNGSGALREFDFEARCGQATA